MMVILMRVMMFPVRETEVNSEMTFHLTLVARVGNGVQTGLCGTLPFIQITSQTLMGEKDKSLNSRKSVFPKVFHRIGL